MNKPMESESTNGSIFAPCNSNCGDSVIELLSSFEHDVKRCLLGFAKWRRMGLEVIRGGDGDRRRRSEKAGLDGNDGGQDWRCMMDILEHGENVVAKLSIMDRWRNF